MISIRPSLRPPSLLAVRPANRPAGLSTSRRQLRSAAPSQCPDPSSHPRPQERWSSRREAPKKTTTRHLDRQDEPRTLRSSASSGLPAVPSDASFSNLPSSTSPEDVSALVKLARRLRQRYDPLDIQLSVGPHEDRPLEKWRSKFTFAGAREDVKRDLKPIVIVVLAIGLGYGVYFYGSHALIENVGMGAPASLWELDLGPETEKRWWGWELENDDWTGSLEGGTDPRLPRQVREGLRYAWLALFWPLGLTEQDVRDQIEQDQLQAENGPTLLKTIKTAIHWDSSEFSSATAASLETELPTSALAEHYVREAIERAVMTNGLDLRLPPALPLEPLPLPSSILQSPRRQRPTDTTGIALVIRHAALLESVGSEETLIKAQKLFERVLRAVDGWKGAETLEAQLARRIGDLGKLNGDPRAEEWLRWGLERLTGDGGRPEIGKKSDSLLGWLWSWTRNTTPPSSVADSKPSASTSTPISTVVSLKTAQDLPPSRQRALLSLVASISAAQSRPTTLDEAQRTQLAALDFVSPAISAEAREANSTSPEANLHVLALRRYQALFYVHLAEVLYASVLKDRACLTPANLLQKAFDEAASVSASLANPSLSSTSLPTFFANKRPLPSEPSGPYSHLLKPTVLDQPAKDLLVHSRRTAASAANLLGFLALAEASSSAATATADALESARKHYAAAMTYVGSPPPANEGQKVGSIGGKEEEVHQQSDEWTRYYQSYRSVCARLDAMKA